MALTITAKRDGPTPLPDIKAPADRLLYRMDWAAFLVPLGDAISPAAGASVWSVIPQGVSLGSGQVETGNLSTTVWIEGGMAGESYTVSNKITTVAGRVVERSFVLRVGGR